jgi:hypothetical protein
LVGGAIGYGRRELVELERLRETEKERERKRGGE